MYGLKSLVGRAFTFYLYPFSFREFLRAKNEKLVQLVGNIALQTELKKLAEEFVIFEGVLYESYVFEELLKADLTFHFWRSKSKAEVDFVVKQNHRVIPIEVKAGHPQITRSFRSFIQRYAPEKAFVVNSEVQERGKIEATFVRKVFFSEMVNLQNLIM